MVTHQGRLFWRRVRSGSWGYPTFPARWAAESRSSCRDGPAWAELGRGCRAGWWPWSSSPAEVSIVIIFMIIFTWPRFVFLLLCHFHLAEVRISVIVMFIFTWPMFGLLLLSWSFSPGRGSYCYYWSFSPGRGSCCYKVPRHSVNVYQTNHAIRWNRSRDLFQPIAWFVWYTFTLCRGTLLLSRES